MSIFLGDLRIKSAIELGLEDIAKNNWLINDILGDVLGNPYLRQRYASQIESCKQWFANNKINIYMSERDDKMDFPCVTIALGDSNEKEGMKTMGDISTETQNFVPNFINKPIPFVIAPGAGTYNSTTGLWNFTDTTVNLTLVAPGMLLVDPKTGIGFKILSVDSTGISIGTSMTVPASVYCVLPQFQYYQAKIGHTFFDESYEIVCNAMDQQTNLWLHNIVMYSLLRYRQSLLEVNGFSQCLIKNSKLYLNPEFSDESQEIWSRRIILSGQTEGTWIMAPHRFIETVNFKDPDQNEGYYGGIKIISNLNDTENLANVNWAAIADSMDNG